MSFELKPAVRVAMPASDVETLQSDLRELSGRKLNARERFLATRISNALCVKQEAQDD